VIVTVTCPESAGHASLVVTSYWRGATCVITPVAVWPSPQSSAAL
jgi:hypothetical protein